MRQLSNRGQFPANCCRFYPVQSDEETWNDQPKENYKNKDKLQRQKQKQRQLRQLSNRGQFPANCCRFYPVQSDEKTCNDQPKENYKDKYKHKKNTKTFKTIFEASMQEFKFCQ